MSGLTGIVPSASDSDVLTSGFTFGQLIRGDGNEAQKEIRRLFNSRPRRPVAASISTLPKLLKLIAGQVYGTQMRALLDSGAIPNVMNAFVVSSKGSDPDRYDRP